MNDAHGLKVFISWSGQRSKVVAATLRSWLPLLFDNVAPWMSDTDIAAGQRGLPAIEEQLRNARFGIIVVTTENQGSPWLNFEAGALSRVITDETEHRVVPLLVDLGGPAQLVGPLTQFQARTLGPDGIQGLLRSLAEVVGIPTDTIDKRFDAYWPRLEKSIADDLHAHPSDGEPTVTRRPADDMLDEILEHVRRIQLSSVPVAIRGVTRPEWERISEGVGAVADLMSVEVNGFTLHGPDGSGLAVFVDPSTSPDQFDPFGLRLSQVIGRPVVVSYQATPSS